MEQILLELLKETVCAYCACLAFGVVFRLRGGKLAVAASGGAIGWLVYAACMHVFTSEILCYFLATVALSVFAEGMARQCRAPASIYLIVAIIPLVPGGGIYSTMEYFIQGQSDAATAAGLHTLGIAGALAIGIVLVSSTVRMLYHHRVVKAAQDMQRMDAKTSGQQKV